MNSLPDNNLNINIKSYVLDPLTVIIKLAILGNKPIGTKLLICNNTIYFQNPGIMQTIYRIYYKSNKTDLQYLYNPIHIACQYYLSSTFIAKNPRIVHLFECAQLGIERLSETYNHCAIITLCFNYYYTIIKNYLDKDKPNESKDNLFQKDRMTSLYSTELVNILNESWTDEKIKIILDLICFLNKDNMANENVKSLENIIENIDKDNYNIVNKNC
jgi:hypothetical protein